MSEADINANASGAIVYRGGFGLNDLLGGGHLDEMLNQKLPDMLGSPCHEQEGAAMPDPRLEGELQEIGVAIAGIEVAVWAAMRAILEVNPEAAELLSETYPRLLEGISGDHADEVKARVETHMQRWLPK